MTGSAGGTAAANSRQQPLLERLEAVVVGQRHRPAAEPYQLVVELGPVHEPSFGCWSMTLRSAPMARCSTTANVALLRPMAWAASSGVRPER